MCTLISRLTGLFVAVGLIAGISANASAASCQIAAGPVAATVDLYTKMTAREACVLEYVPTEGFDEIDTLSEHHHLGADAFRGLFASQMAIDFHVEGVEAQLFGNTAVVTGIRVGGIAPAGAVPANARTSFTMVWVLSEGKWQLRHVHLSPMSLDK